MSCSTFLLYRDTFSPNGLWFVCTLTSQCVSLAFVSQAALGFMTVLLQTKVCLQKQFLTLKIWSNEAWRIISSNGFFWVSIHLVSRQCSIYWQTLLMDLTINLMQHSFTHILFIPMDYLPKQKVYSAICCQVTHPKRIRINRILLIYNTISVHHGKQWQVSC